MGFFTAVNIRTFVLRAASLDGLVELGSMTPRAASLETSVRAGLNILETGGTQAGKANAAATSHVRLVKVTFPFAAFVIR